MTPTYIGLIPTPPTPADGSCSESDNTYSYKQLSGGVSYQLSFCLGAQAGGYSPGNHTLSPTGIQ